MSWSLTWQPGGARGARVVGDDRVLQRHRAEGDRVRHRCVVLAGGEAAAAAHGTVAGDGGVLDDDVGAAAVVDPAAPAGALAHEQAEQGGEGAFLQGLDGLGQREQRVAGERAVDHGAARVEPQAAAGVGAVVGDEAVADDGRGAGGAEHAAAPVGAVTDQRHAVEGDGTGVEDGAAQRDRGRRPAVARVPARDSHPGQQRLAGMADREDAVEPGAVDDGAVGAGPAHGHRAVDDQVAVRAVDGFRTAGDLVRRLRRDAQPVAARRHHDGATGAAAGLLDGRPQRAAAAGGSADARAVARRRVRGVEQAGDRVGGRAGSGGWQHSREPDRRHEGDDRRGPGPSCCPHDVPLVRNRLVPERNGRHRPAQGRSDRHDAGPSAPQAEIPSTAREARTTSSATSSRRSLVRSAMRPAATS
ncbi:MAG: hypothetical protein JWO60_1082 [Frankiales bacterium]|nr:hypothetical protein [Frankiales bacterium]